MIPRGTEVEVVVLGLTYFMHWTLMERYTALRLQNFGTACIRLPEQIHMLLAVATCKQPQVLPRQLVPTLVCSPYRVVCMPRSRPWEQKGINFLALFQCVKRREVDSLSAGDF